MGCMERNRIAHECASPVAVNQLLDVFAIGHVSKVSIDRKPATAIKDIPLTHSPVTLNYHAAPCCLYLSLAQPYTN